MTRLAIGCWMFAWALGAAASEPADFRFAKPIERSGGKEAILAVPLDGDVYAGTRDGFPDLRVFDAGGKEVPYQIEKATEPQTETVRDSRPANVTLHPQADGLEILIQIPADEPPADGLAIFTPLRNYERRVRILGSADGKTWTPLVEDGLVFDYSRYMDVENHEVRLPKNDYRRLKVLVAGPIDTKESPFQEMTRKYRGPNEVERTETTTLERRPFRIDRIELWRDRTETVAERDKKADYVVSIAGVEENSKEKLSIIQLNNRRAPLQEMTLETTSRNFRRAVELETPVRRGETTDWVNVASGRISLVSFRGYHKESLRIEFPEQRQGEYRIVIHNEDNQPLRVSGVKARGPVYQVIFLAAENQSYRLGYGANHIERPSYDIAAVLGPLRTEGNRPTLARLGQEIANFAIPPPPGYNRNLLTDPLVWGAVIVVLVILLGWALYRATRRINDIPKEP